MCWALGKEKQVRQSKPRVDLTGKKQANVTYIQTNIRNVGRKNIMHSVLLEQKEFKRD